MKTYKLLAPDGKTYESQTPGLLGGYKKDRIYGRLDCRSALNFLSKGQYAAHRVFFADSQYDNIWVVDWALKWTE